MRTENNNQNDEDAAGVDRLDARSVIVNKMLLAAGCWLLAAGCWLLAAGCWLLSNKKKDHANHKL
jgi:hypothetical protein